MKKEDSLKQYYKGCAIPKPQDKKKKKAVNGWKDKPNRYCIVCGAGYAERHEIFGGSNRQYSIDDGLQIDLCMEHHRWWHESTDEEAMEWRKQWRRKAQRCYEKRLIDAGAKPVQARKIFMKRYGVNLLTEDETCPDK